MPEPNIEGQKKRWLDRGDRVGPSYSGATSRTIIYSKMLIGVWQHTKYLLHLFPGIWCIRMWQKLIWLWSHQTLVQIPTSLSSLDDLRKALILFTYWFLGIKWESLYGWLFWNLKEVTHENQSAIVPACITSSEYLCSPSFYYYFFKYSCV